ncbi:MAG: EamA family transporter [Desulfobacterales bacterium]|nr:MAG: EamA family transporter [Desulfobacterales bacterium]
MDGRMKGYACILLAAFFWGAIGPLGRTAFVEGVSPMEVAFWRAALAWGFFAVHAGIKKEMRVHRSDIPMILLFGTACVTCFYGAYQQAVAGGGAALASVLLYTAPAWVGVLARIFLKEAMTPVKLIALAMTILGVTGVSGGSPAGFSPAGMRTIGFGLLSGFCYALYYIFGKIFAERYSSPNLFLYALPVGAITLFPLVDFVPKTPTAWLALFLMALFSTYLAYYCYYIALKYLESTRAAIAAALEPVIASILGVVWWKEDLSFIAVCGGLLILSAVILVIRDSAPPADMQADGLSSAPPA